MFVVQVAELKAPEINIHPSQIAQITDGDPMQIAALKQDEVLTKILVKYSDFADVFLVEEALVLLEYTKLNKHAIELKDGKQLLYGPIYSLGPVELKILKTYIKTHLKTRFIRPFKFFAGAPIFFDKKPDGSFHLYVDYRGFKNLTIKIQYSLPLISELLDRLGLTKRFT